MAKNVRGGVKGREEHIIREKVPERQENDMHGWIRESDSTVRDRRGRIEKNKKQQRYCDGTGKQKH